MVISSRDLSHDLMLNENKINSSKEEKLLGIFLDNKLNLESYRLSLQKKQTKK